MNREKLNNDLQEIYEHYYSRKPINEFYQIIGEIYVDIYPNVEEAEKRISEFVEKELQKIKSEE